MGLIFALQQDVKDSKDKIIQFSSHKRRFSLGTGFIFLFCLLITMHRAAKPLLVMMWEEGGFLDYFLVILFYAFIGSFIIATLYCWFFKEFLSIKQESPFKFKVFSYKSLLGIKWAQKTSTIEDLNQLEIKNWMGSKNVAKISEDKKAKKDKYSTKGHWMLSSTNDHIIERRAQKADIDLVKSLILHHFGIKNLSSDAQS